MQELRKEKEGSVEIFVPVTDIPEHALVFYNPEQKLNRDISVGVINAYAKDKKDLVLLDLMSASGIRALRYEKECNNIEKIIANDINDDAIDLMKKNIELNNSKKIEISQEDANIYLTKNRYSHDYIDIDPFGPPVYFLNNAAKAFPKNGLLAATATDTAPLCGSYPSTCLRKYGVKSVKTHFNKELGIRIMITNIIRNFAQNGVAFRPVLSHATRHYMRVYGKTRKVKTSADKVLKELDHVSYCNCGYHKFGLIEKCPDCDEDMKLIEPIWSGTINDKEFCKLVREEMGNDENIDDKSRDLVDTLIEESDMSPFYYDIHKMARKQDWGEVPSMKKIKKALKDKGFSFSRTHFTPTGIKTDAGFETVKILNTL